MIQELLSRNINGKHSCLCPKTFLFSSRLPLHGTQRTSLLQTFQLNVAMTQYCRQDHVLGIEFVYFPQNEYKPAEKCVTRIFVYVALWSELWLKLIFMGWTIGYLQMKSPFFALVLIILTLAPLILVCVRHCFCYWYPGKLEPDCEN